MSESSNQPEMTCQWCSGTVPAGEDACSKCGAARPREDLVAPGFTPRDEAPAGPDVQWAQSETAELTEEEVQARQILRDLDAYVPDETPPPRTTSRDPSDDLFIVVIALGASVVVGALLGWFVAPTLIHDLFNDVLGIDTDGPEAFRRLGAFIGAMVAMLFGALLVTVMRR